MTLDYPIRVARNADKENIFAFITPILNEYGFCVDTTTSESDLVDIQYTYTDSGGWLNVMEEQGEIIGTIGFFPVEEGVGKIRKMYLKPSLRGKGLGKLLLLNTLEKAKSLGFRSVVLETTRVMKEAIGLYRRVGFKEVEQDPTSPRCELVFRLDL